MRNISILYELKLIFVILFKCYCIILSMIKFKTILTKIKLIYLRINGKIKKKYNSIEINHSNNRDIKNILIIFPIKEKSFRVALYSFRNLFKMKNVNYFFIVNNVYRHHFHLSGYVFDLFFNLKKERVRIDETFFEERIINKKFDMIIDLNDDFFYDICSFINNLDGYYKVGIKKKYSDYFYNIQLKGDILENTYDKIRKMIN